MIIYMVYKSQGVYDDYFEQNMKGFISKGNAQDFVDKLTKEKNRVVSEENAVYLEYDLDSFTMDLYVSPLYELMVKDLSECCRMIKESNLYDKDWLEENAEYHISEVEIVDTTILNDCLDIYNYQQEYINFLLGGYSEEEFMEISRKYAKVLNPGESMWDDPFDKLKILIESGRIRA